MPENGHYCTFIEKTKGITTNLTQRVKLKSQSIKI